MRWETLLLTGERKKLSLLIRASIFRSGVKNWILQYQKADLAKTSLSKRWMKPLFVLGMSINWGMRKLKCANRVVLVGSRHADTGLWTLLCGFKIPGEQGGIIGLLKKGIFQHLLL